MLITPRKHALLALREARRLYPTICNRASARFVVARSIINDRVRRIERTGSPRLREVALPIYRDTLALLNN